MKSILVSGVILSVFFISCSNEKNTRTIDPVLKEEIQTLVMDSIKVEQATLEIEETTKKLDELLNEL